MSAPICVSELKICQKVQLVMTPESFRVVADAFQKHLALMDKVEKSKQEAK